MNSMYLKPLKAIDLFAGIRRGFKNIFKENIEFVFSSEFACQAFSVAGYKKGFF